MRQGRSRFLSLWLLFGFLFLYGPIASMIFFSFNASRLATVWGGFSAKWYGELFHNELILQAAWLSLQIAAISATLATALGTMAGIALARFGRFRGRLLLGGMVTAPLVMPEVITGLSLLLLFVAMEDLIGWPAGRGMVTITIAHVTFSLAYVAIVVQSRLSEMDAALEEAAMDLGSRPLRVIFDITLPLLTPAMLSGWLLAFTLSLDDLVIATFTSGPGASTLPMLIYSKVRLGLTPDINALATIIILVVTTAVVVGASVMNRRSLRQLRDMQAAAASNA